MFVVDALDLHLYNVLKIMASKAAQLDAMSPLCPLLPQYHGPPALPPTLKLGASCTLSHPKAMVPLCPLLMQPFPV